MVEARLLVIMACLFFLASFDRVYRSPLAACEPIVIHVGYPHIRMIGNLCLTIVATKSATCLKKGVIGSFNRASHLINI